MHQQGYTFIGPTAIAKLTYPEIETLVLGFDAEQRVQYDKEHGIKPEHRDGFDDFVDSLDDDAPATAATDATPGSANVTPPGYTPKTARPTAHRPPRR